VQPSSGGDPGGNIVPITAEGTFGVQCLRIREGQTVEWRNTAPDVPANVTSLGEPTELYSPSLVSPYNLREEDGEAHVFWRHTFETPGVFEYFDTNQGDPGRKVVDAYYGTVTFVGISDDVVTGVVCVEGKGSSACDGVCCVKSSDCPSGQCCDAAQKRCVLGSPSAPTCSGKPAYRQFECFVSADCGAGQTCDIETHKCK
jgi:plastocyanin